MRIILARWFLLSIPKLNFYAEGWSENIWFDSEQHQHNRMSIVASVGGRFSPWVYLLFNIHYLRIPMIDKLIDLCQEHRLEQSLLSFQVRWPLKEWWCHLLYWQLSKLPLQLSLRIYLRWCWCCLWSFGQGSQLVHQRR